MERRIRWIDSAKGFALLLVLIGHSLSSPLRNNEAWCMTAYEFIYSFHVHFFMFVSGCCFAVAEKRYIHTSPGAFLKKKAKSFLLPYFTYNAVLYLLFALLGKIESLSMLMGSVGKEYASLFQWGTGLLTGDNVYCYPTWYLYSLFFLYVAAYLIIRLFPENNAKRKAVCIAAAVLFMILYYSGILHPIEGLKNMSFFMLWFILGWQLYGISLPAFVSAILIAVPLGAYVIYFMNPFLENHWWILQMSKNILCVMTSIGLVNLFPYFKGKVEKMFHFIGSHSMEIYLFHQPFIGSGVGGVLYLTLGAPAFLAVAVSVLLSVVLPVIAGYIIKKIPGIRVLFSL